MKDLNANELLQDLAKGLDNYLTEQNIKEPIFIGIQTGGVWVAKQLQALVKQ